MKKKSHKLFNLFIFIILILVGLIFYSRYLGTKGLIVKEYKVESSILPSNFSGIKIVHFSDLFYGSIEMNDVKELVDKVNLLKPDIIVFTGDLKNESVSLSEENETKLIEYLSSLNATIGKYAVYGENDYSFSNYEILLNDSGFKILKDSYDKIYYKSNEFIYIVGLSCIQKENVDLDSAFDFYKDEDRKYIILLAHDGKTLKEVDNSTYEVDLVLLGHSLNGSVVLPYYGGVFLDETSYKYYDNYYQKGITNIFVSSGIGTNKYNYRLLNKPSFNLYRLKAQS